MWLNLGDIKDYTPIIAVVVGSMLTAVFVALSQLFNRVGKLEVGQAKNEMVQSDIREIRLSLNALQISFAQFAHQQQRDEK